MAIAQAVASRISLSSASTNPINQAEQPSDASAPSARDALPSARVEIPSSPTRTEPVDATRSAEETDAPDLREHF
eukprot:1946234-Pleurochrysis_carterae.AAC.1